MESRETDKNLFENKVAKLELLPPEVRAMEFYKYKENQPQNRPHKQEVVAREKVWLEKQLSRDNVKENKWPTIDSKSKALKVVPIASERKEVLSPLAKVGPGTTRATYHRRVVKYGGSSSEGNRFVNNSDL